MGNYEQMGEISHLRLSLTVIVERESYCCTTDVTDTTEKWMLTLLCSSIYEIPAMCRETFL